MKNLVLGPLVLLATVMQPALAGTDPTLPPEAYAQMKAGHHLGRIWISPAMDLAKGFTIGKVDTLADNYYADTLGYFTGALGRLAFPNAPYVLSLTVVDLNTVDRPAAGHYSATMSVEGKAVDPDGKLVLAFTTREQVGDRETVEANCEGVMDKIVWDLSRDLGAKFQHALEQRDAARKSARNNAPPPPAPPVQAQPMDVPSRLMQLEDLKRRGLITDEEYKTHREEILKGL